MRNRERRETRKVYPPAPLLRLVLSVLFTGEQRGQCRVRATRERGGVRAGRLTWAREAGSGGPLSLRVSEREGGGESERKQETE